jgi:hypothetical protein
MLPNAVAVSKREHWRGDLVHMAPVISLFLKIENYIFVYQKKLKRKLGCSQLFIL